MGRMTKFSDKNVKKCSKIGDNVATYAIHKLHHMRINIICLNVESKQYHKESYTEIYGLKIRVRQKSYEQITYFL